MTNRFNNISQAENFLFVLLSEYTKQIYVPWKFCEFFAKGSVPEMLDGIRKLVKNANGLKN
jgi:hypothetical protein